MERPNGQAEVFERLRDFARTRDRKLRVGAVEPQALHGQCELCSLPLTEVHRHLFEVATQGVVCACDGCALTFEGVANGRYKPVPRDARALPDDVAEAIPWEQLSLPINLAFFVREDEAGTVSASYPSPGGVTRSTVPIDTVDEIFDANGILGSLEPRVEALLVNRLTQKTEAFVIPIDLCYELTGLIRLNWRGFSGGEDVRREMNAFFDRLRSRARPLRSG